jgi:hypothetical protein
MRIAMFSWESLHSNSIAIGGVAVHVSEFAAELQRNNEVHVFTRKGPLPSQKHDDLCEKRVTYHWIPYYETEDLLKNPASVCDAYRLPVLI